jgi:hypothetical protein
MKLRRWLAALFVLLALGGSTQVPRDSRLGSPLVLSRVHWVRPEIVVEFNIRSEIPHRRPGTGPASTARCKEEGLYHELRPSS